MKITFKTIGCRVNIAETENLKDKLVKLGFSLASPKKKVNIAVVNTCCVTSKADRKSRQAIFYFLRKKPKILIITGCGARLYRKEYSKYGLVVIDKRKIPGILVDYVKNNKSSTTNYSPLIRAFIKIQEGCNNRCSYCIVPFVRGREKSIKEKVIIETIKEKEKQGFKEIILSGTHLANWEEEGKNLYHLIKDILNKTSIPRIRLSSFEPQDFDLRIIDLFKNKRLCPHIHLALQHTENKILSLMKRPYKYFYLKKLIGKLHEIKDLAISADVIVGFPGETEKDFSEMYQKLKKLSLFKLHVFPFSPRPGTEAYSLENQVEEKIKKKRSETLRDLSLKLEKKFIQKIVGEEREVLFEAKKGNYWAGLTDNYQRVYLKSRRNLLNCLLKIKLFKKHFIGPKDWKI